MTVDELIEWKRCQWIIKWRRYFVMRQSSWHRLPSVCPLPGIVCPLARVPIPAAHRQSHLFACDTMTTTLRMLMTKDLWGNLVAAVSFLKILPSFYHLASTETHRPPAPAGTPLLVAFYDRRLGIRQQQQQQQKHRRSWIAEEVFNVINAVSIADIGILIIDE